MSSMSWMVPFRSEPSLHGATTSAVRKRLVSFASRIPVQVRPVELSVYVTVPHTRPSPVIGFNLALTSYVSVPLIVLYFPPAIC